MKKILSMLLVLCLLIGAVPPQALAYAGDMWPPNTAEPQTLTLSDGTLVLQNDYIRAELHHSLYSAYLSTIPTILADPNGTSDAQWPYCELITYDQGAETPHYVNIAPKNVSFTDRTPHGAAKAIKVVYALTCWPEGKGIPQNTKLTGTITVYHELVRLGADAKTWGVLTSVGVVCIDRKSFPESFNTDISFRWGYTLSAFTSMGHASAAGTPGGPAIKLNRITVPDQGETTTETTVVTSAVQNMNTEHYLKGYAQAGVLAGRMYITEAYVDAYPWANPFVGLSGYGEMASDTDSIRTALPHMVSVTPNSIPYSSRVSCGGYIGFHFSDSEYLSTDTQSFLWGFRDLRKVNSESVPSLPDKVDSSFAAQRLAAFASGDGVTVEYVADDAALEALKKQYGTSPAAVISGSCESVNGSSFEFTGGAALLSPSVTATWNSGGSLVIRRDGTVVQHGVSLNAPTFKFYQPKSGAEDSLTISLTKDGFAFGIAPAQNEAVIYIDIPYASAKLENVAADADGNLVFSGDIGFQTLFDGAEFSLEKLGYGLQEKTVNGKKTYEFKVNGVHATGSFDTAAMLGLELASVEGEVNTFKGEERYAFSLELNAFDLFETEAELALTRSKKDGSLIPDNLWFYVKASPGIVLIPPVPIGQLNGGGAGFKNLAATVNGDYFAIPPLKLRGALTGTYLHLVEGTGNVVIGPSEISLTATDVGIVGAGDATKIIDRFGYALRLDGQERTYQGKTYTGIYFSGSEQLSLSLPNKAIDMLVIDSSIEMGAFGGVDDTKKTLYLGIGANGKVIGTVQIPNSAPIFKGLKLGSNEIQLIIGGQTTIPIRGVSVSEGMKQAFKNTDVYLGAMTQVNGWISAARAWVVVPNVIKTKFRYGEGWGIEVNLRHKFGDWDWEAHGVTPVVQSSAVLLEADDTENLSTASPQRITVNAGAEETPYILLAFDKDVSEEEIRNALQVEQGALPINWVGEDGLIDLNADINATTVVLPNAEHTAENRIAILRMKNSGEYTVSAGELAFTAQSGGVAPFEELDLSQSGHALSGSVKYPVSGTKYVLRTYLGTESGEATYLVDEQSFTGADSITVSIPDSGALLPTGDYYVTSFLMTEKQADSNGDGKLEDTLFTIASQEFTDTVSYTNTNQPEQPASVSLEPTGNEVMHAAWTKVDGADGYAVRIYQQNGSDWVDTGFGYDLDKNTDSIDMALTVGGQAENGSENLSANQTYKIGVQAYKTVENGKYYSTETQSNEKYLPKYTPLNLSLAVNGIACTADENGVYHADVNDAANVLTVSSSDTSATFKVTRMDTNAEIPTAAPGEFTLPAFEGSLMFKIDGISGLDVTSVFLLVNADRTPPVLTLSAPVFYADQTTGQYTVTGTADAGSEILFGGQQTVYAGSDGTFAVSGALEDERSTDESFYLYAQDSAGNVSAPQLALISRENRHSVTVNGSYAANSGAGSYSAGETVKLSAGTRSGWQFSGWTSDSGLSFADAAAADTTFTMPGTDVTVTANWTRSGGSGGGSSGGSGGSGGTPTYPPVLEQPTGGTISVMPKVPQSGSAVTITVEPKDGYTVKNVTVTDKTGKIVPVTDLGGGKYRYTQPGGTVTIRAELTFGCDGGADCLMHAFADVDPALWYHDGIHYCLENGLMNGISADTFAPNAAITRGMLVTILHRLEDEPQAAASAFTDVPSGAYYAKAVAWAAQHGIVTGYDAAHFGSNDPITREQLAVILYRYAQYKQSGTDADTGADLSAYTDAQTISGYAVTAVKWACGTGLMNGVGGSVIAPQSGATRAQTAKMLELLGKLMQK